MSVRLPIRENGKKLKDASVLLNLPRFVFIKSSEKMFLFTSKCKYSMKKELYVSGTYLITFSNIGKNPFLPILLNVIFLERGQKSCKKLLSLHKIDFPINSNSTNNESAPSEIIMFPMMNIYETGKA